eukprot:scaffold122553_cov35-Attheya_sp.AAC.1
MFGIVGAGDTTPVPLGYPPCAKFVYCPFGALLLSNVDFVMRSAKKSVAALSTNGASFIKLKPSEIYSRGTGRSASFKCM